MFFRRMYEALERLEAKQAEQAKEAGEIVSRVWECDVAVRCLAQEIKDGIDSLRGEIRGVCVDVEAVEDRVTALYAYVSTVLERIAVIQCRLDEMGVPLEQLQGDDQQSIMERRTQQGIDNILAYEPGYRRGEDDL